ncbi:hypothetical protein B5F77_06300 [Parabacteroides sp. An277]|uniref:outer membrane beta-barrel protein n=1 Tax=Parabacteroides sp. An277 TaxID=1965619 RepID=UPI000B39B49E|nr:outer membrane beta-barrel protein [Parabacteroides sp. An277]OUO53145.1 hypothetical protein B5F77_06300 [Parabacteroides sp. An277]
MKRITILLSLLCICLGAVAQTQRGHSSVGFNVGYGFESENATLGVDYRYCITDEVRIAPSLTYFVKADDLSAVAIDLNAHYVIKLSDVFGFYPLAGVDLAFWKLHHVAHVNDFGKVKDSSTETRLGVNVGIGGEIYATEQLSLGLEVKYNIVKDIDQALLALRVGYSF